MRLAGALLVLLALSPRLASAQTPAPASAAQAPASPQPAPPQPAPPQPAPPQPTPAPPVPPPGTDPNLFPYGPPPGYGPPSEYGPPGYQMWPPLSAEPPAPEHEGFYLRLSFGVGYGRASITTGGEATTIVGTSLASSLAIGGAIAPNLILYAGFVDHSLFSPDYKVDGTTVTEGGDSILFSGFGPGIAYYFMPSNMYVAGTLLLGRLAQAAPGGAEVISNRGPALEALLGKEWWVSENWGLGVNAQLVLARLPAQGIDDATFNVVQSAILVSATFN